jgi:hypothetical protein
MVTRPVTPTDPTRHVDIEGRGRGHPDSTRFSGRAANDFTRLHDMPNRLGEPGRC